MRAKELQDEARSLKGLESETDNRTDLSDNQRQHRKDRLDKQRLALADEAMALAVFAAEPARSQLLTAARVLREPVHPIVLSISKRQLNKLRGRLNAVEQNRPTSDHG